ncbi:MFS peptide transporter [Lophiostoma macrostomum CBS 122681]|uniref:MFS peptide transporter n=1 Tax=Lophiostoma macrostomum CBS 122681 TaxID=1314788 RepID=A0A6A6TFQ6_9PLEO|nr:MFS peptide transporter [Lophiostoma macrostomum CBS 122681]
MTLSTTASNQPETEAESGLTGDKEDSKASPPTVVESAGGSEPSEDDLKTLRRVSGKLPWSSALSIAIFEMFESFSLNGTLVVLVNLLQHPLPLGSTTGAGHGRQSGVLGFGQRASTSFCLARAAFMNVMPLFGAFISERYFGCYNTLQSANLIIFLGQFTLTLAVTPSMIAYPQGALGMLITGIIVMGVGFGGYRPNVITLLADQVTDHPLKVTVNPKGKRIIVDDEITRTRVLLYFSCLTNFGSSIGMTAAVCAEKYIGFWLSFAVSTIISLCCPLILHFYRKSYVQKPPTVSVLKNVWRLWALAMKPCWSWNPLQMYRNVQHPEFRNRVKPSILAKKPAWMDFEDSWVDEVSRGLRACRVFCWFLLYWPAIRQMSSNLTSQAATLSLGKISNDVLISFNPFSYIILAIVYDLLIYPATERFGFRFTPIQRMSFGFGSSALAITYAAVTQYFIYKRHPCGTQANSCVEQGQRSDISVWVQIPIYILLANAEILAGVTGMEYACSQAPGNMKSMVMAAWIFTGAGGSAIGGILLLLSEDPNLFWNYTVVAVLSAIACIGVWFSNK